MKGNVQQLYNLCRVQNLKSLVMESIYSITSLLFGSYCTEYLEIFDTPSQRHRSVNEKNSIRFKRGKSCGKKNVSFFREIWIVVSFRDIFFLELIFQWTDAKPFAINQSYTFYLLKDTVWHLRSNIFLSRSFVTFPTNCLKLDYISIFSSDNKSLILKWYKSV